VDTRCWCTRFPATTCDDRYVDSHHQTPNKAPEPRRDSSRLVLWNVPSK
jgi:hypothetical protein